MSDTITQTSGAHIVNGPLTTSLTRQTSPTLLRNEIDTHVVKVRPSASPLDQISRMGIARRAGSMIVDYYSVDTKASSTKTTASATIAAGQTVSIKVECAPLVAESETLLVPSVKVGESENPLVLYTVSRSTDGKLSVVGANLDTDESVTLKSGTELVRMGRAAAELDVQTPSYEALPVKSTNYCQIFKAQIEESTLQRMTNKEVGWTFNDQEEVAIIDMRMGMERSFLFGSKASISDPAKNQDVMLTGGIWHQTTHDFTYDPSKPIDAGFIADITARAFVGNGGSQRKILLAGSGLIKYLQAMPANHVLAAGDTVTRWGISFSALQSKFGTLWVVFSEVFDNCGMADNGMIIDPEFITKYSFIPMSAQRLDLRKSGIRNTNAVVVTEASCLTLRYPEAHTRIIAKRAPAETEDAEGDGDNSRD